MPICVLREQLADYDAWKTGFYAHFDAAQMGGAGVTLEAIYRDADDANVILTVVRFASREQGEAMLVDPAARAEMEANRVDLSTLRPTTPSAGTGRLSNRRGCELRRPSPS